MKIFDELHKTMDAFAENISKEVSEKRFFEVAEVKAIVKTRLWFAIKECLTLQVTDAEAKRRELVQQYNTNAPNWKKVEIGKEIAKINALKSDANRVLHSIQDYDDYRQLRNFIKEKMGREAGIEFLNDFDQNYVDHPENRKNKGAEKHLKEISK